MTRRGALAVVVAIMGAWVKSAAASQQNMSTHSGISIGSRWEAMPLRFELDTFKEFQIIQGGRTIVVTPAELFEALQLSEPAKP